MYRLLAVGAVALAFLASGSQASAGPLISAGQGSLQQIAPPYWKLRGCDHNHPTRVGYRVVRRVLRVERPLKGGTVKRLRRFAVCVQTRAKSKAVWSYVRRSLKWRKAYEHVWPIRFHALPSGEQGWAVSTSSCEAGMDPAKNTGNGFLGAFQFMPGTWAKAVAMYGGGWPSSPTSASWHHQAVVAVRWKWHTSDEQWPVCGD